MFAVPVVAPNVSVVAAFHAVNVVTLVSINDTVAWPS